VKLGYLGEFSSRGMLGGVSAPHVRASILVKISDVPIVYYPHDVLFLADREHLDLMTGIGAYCYIVWGIWLRHVLNSNQDQYKISWPHLYTLPEIIRTEDTSNLKNMANGHSKKID
jgi:hypothetical protein